MRSVGLTSFAFYGLLFGCFLCSIPGVDSSEEGETAEIHEGEEFEEEEHSEPAFAVLFPPFTLTVGVLVFFVLTRYVKALPYTAVSRRCTPEYSHFLVASHPHKTSTGDVYDWSVISCLEP